MPKFDMVYNSQKEELVISEYGRNLQNLVNRAKEMEDKAYRQRYIEEMVNLLNIMNPHNRNMAEYKEKLWNHIFRIANYDLDVDVPEGITIHLPSNERVKAHLPYPQKEFRFRHYGHYIQDMIRKALEMEEGPKRDGYSEVIASYMKLAYRTFNKEHYVNDEIIKQDLLAMSGSKLTFSDDYSIENLVSMKTKMGQTTNNKSRLFGSNSKGKSNGKQNKRR